MAALAFLVPSALHVSAPRRLRSSVILKPRRSRYKNKLLNAPVDEDAEEKVQIEVVILTNILKCIYLFKGENFGYSARKKHQEADWNCSSPVTNFHDNYWKVSI